MFNKKTLDNIKDIRTFIENYVYKINSNIASIESFIEMISKNILENKNVLISIKDILKSQKETIDFLIGLHGETDNCELYVYKDYRNAPVIYLNGKKISDDDIINFYITWDYGEKVNVEVNR